MTVVALALAALALGFIGGEAAVLTDRSRHWTDTSGWVGSNYMPAKAVNSMWWIDFDTYVQDISQEIRAARRVFGTSAIRVFLNMESFLDNPTRFAKSVRRFVDMVGEEGVNVGLVFMDDAWNHNLQAEDPSTGACIPTLGRSNGCWMATPIDVHRPSIDNLDRDLKPYFQAVVDALDGGSHEHLIFLEVYNEPCDERYAGASICSWEQATWAVAARHAGYRWLKEMEVRVPVISSWTNTKDSDMIDFHDYSSNGKAWASQLQMNSESETTGAMVTEAGCRWYSNTLSDSGSPLTVLHFLKQVQVLTHLAGGKRGAGRVKWGNEFLVAPAVFMAWELFVSRQGCRWQNFWGEAPSEPSIPWCGLMFPDFTPVSLAESAAIRAYTEFANIMSPGREQLNTLLAVPVFDFSPDLAAQLDQPSLVESQPSITTLLPTGNSFLVLRPGVGDEFSVEEAASNGGWDLEVSFWPESRESEIEAHIEVVWDVTQSAPLQSEAPLLVKSTLVVSLTLGEATGGGFVPTVRIASPALKSGAVEVPAFERSVQCTDIEGGVTTSGWNLWRLSVRTPTHHAFQVQTAINRQVRPGANSAADYGVVTGWCHDATVLTRVQSIGKMKMVPKGTGAVALDYVGTFPEILEHGAPHGVKATWSGEVMTENGAPIPWQAKAAAVTGQSVVEADATWGLQSVVAAASNYVKSESALLLRSG